MATPSSDEATLLDLAGRVLAAVIPAAIKAVAILKAGSGKGERTA
jgi:hypothetical protein